jgi:hypothetical protein
MTAPAPPLSGFALLDRLIEDALDDLRSARAAATRAGNRENLDRLTRAEEHLNALLEFRHAAVCRRPLPVRLAVPAESSSRLDRPR